MEQDRVTPGTPLAVVTCLLLSGCLTPAGAPSAPSACPFEQVWDAAGAALGDFQIETSDQAAGTLETAWVDVEATTQAGALQRDVNRERLRFVVQVKPDGRGAVATVRQRREEWSPMGARSLQWRAIPGRAAEEEALASAIAKRLKDKGC